MNEKSNVNNTNKNNKKPSYQSYKNLNLNRDNNNSTNMRHDSNHSQDINYQNYVPFNYTQPSMTNPYTSLPQFPLDINSYLLYYQTLLSQGGNPSYTLPQINPIYNGFPPLPQMVNYSTPPQNMMQSNSVSNEPLDRHQDISQHIKNLQNMSKFNPHFMKKRNDSNIDELLKLYQENKDFINGGNVENFKRMKNEEIENDEVINDTKIDSNLSQEDKQMSNKVDLPKKDEKEISTQPKDTEINKNDNAQYEEVNPQLKEKENSDNVDKSIKSDDNSDNNKSNTQLNESISPVSKEDNKMKKEAPNSNESNNKNNIETHNKKEIPIEIDHELSEQIKENFEKGIDFNLADLCFSKQQKEEKTTKPEKKVFTLPIFNLNISFSNNI